VPFLLNLPNRVQPMARQPRAFFAGLPHLVALRVQHQQSLSVDDEDRTKALVLLGEAMQAHGACLHAYGLKQDLVELVATPTSADSLSRAMQAFAKRHAAAFNRRHGRHGGLWAGRFAATALEADPWLLRAMVRVEQPTAESTTRPWSSAAHHAGLRSDPLVSEPAAYWGLGNTPFEREAAYRQLLVAPTPTEWTLALDAALRGGWPLGSESFLLALGARAQRSFVRRPRGRPLKAKISSA
jgi:putative transposase